MNLETPEFNKEHQEAIKKGKTTGPMIQEQVLSSKGREQAVKLLNQFGFTEEEIKKSQLLEYDKDTRSGFKKVLARGHEITVREMGEVFVDGNEVFGREEIDNLNSIVRAIWHLATEGETPQQIAAILDRGARYSPDYNRETHRTLEGNRDSAVDEILGRSSK